VPYLRAVSVGPLVGHGEHAARVVAQRLDDLIVEEWAVDGLAALARARSVAALKEDSKKQ